MQTWFILYKCQLFILEAKKTKKETMSIEFLSLEGQQNAPSN